MDIASFFGIIVGVGLIIGAMALSGNIFLYVSLHGFMIAFGGVIASIFIAYPLKHVIGVFKFLRFVFFKRNKKSILVLVDAFEEFSRATRKDGLLAIETAKDRFDDPFIKQGCQMVADGIPAEEIESILTKDINAMVDRHKIGKDIFRFAMQAGPAFGLIGAVIGIIQMLAALATGTAGPEMIAKMAGGMSVALCATLYGITLAYLIFAPIAQKLANRSDEELNEKLMLLDGFLAIMAGESPMIVRQRMEAFIPPKLRKTV